MRTREHHPPDAVVAHRLKQVYDRAYVVREHWRPVVLLGCARHMHDGVDSLGDAAGELRVCEGAFYELLTRHESTRRSQVGRPQVAVARRQRLPQDASRSEEHTSELQSLMRISYAVF